MPRGETNLRSLLLAGLALAVVSVGWAGWGPLPSGDAQEPLPPRPSSFNLLGTLDYSLRLTERNAELGRQLKEYTKQLYEATAYLEGNSRRLTELMELNEDIAAALERQADLSEGALAGLRDLAEGLDRQTTLVQQSLALARSQSALAKGNRDLTATTLHIQKIMIDVLRENIRQLERQEELEREMKYYAEH